MRRNVWCLLTSHSYEYLRKTEADGEIWRCRRCGRVRYNLPRTWLSSGSIG